MQGMCLRSDHRAGLFHPAGVADAGPQCRDLLAALKFLGGPRLDKEA